ncbi:uncharacterized protein C8Q71DRAFT_236555 [Rhodofomes roseus]|uniref:Uncharacterized protein n=1 Tax=Rhodofomes roseus TaxID=34475 RepID=A0ABQ8KXV5_9APHY|nr:uncharacterized protein C8Q71DRAFT_236555 [Rhodofomes roseus]KAH9843130.1 hypothetical protein C8Q71DRAFT_236555 [Rhodofomes roseus]
MESAVTYVDENIGVAVYEDCQVTDGQAVCEEVVVAMGSSGYTHTVTGTVSMTPFAVQGGGLASGSDAIQTSPVPTGNFATWTFPAVWSSSTSAIDGASSSLSSGGSESSSGAASKTSGSTTATPTGNTNGALTIRAHSLLTVIAAGLGIT